MGQEMNTNENSRKKAAKTVVLCFRLILAASFITAALGKFVDMVGDRGQTATINKSGCIYLSYQRSGLSLREIGNYLGCRGVLLAN